MERGSHAAERLARRLRAAGMTDVYVSAGRGFAWFHDRDGALVQMGWSGPGGPVEVDRRPPEDAAPTPVGTFADLDTAVAAVVGGERPAG